MFSRATPLPAFTALALLGFETPVHMKDLPPQVQKTVQEQTRSAKLVRLSKEIEHGKLFYEAETVRNGNSRDILMDAAGSVVSIEESTALEDLPEAARRAVEARTGSGTILKIETVTRGSQVTYEALIQKRKMKIEVTVDAKGNSSLKTK